MLTYIIVLIVAILVVAVIVLAYCPIQVVLQFDRRHGEEEGEARLEYLFGLIKTKKRLTDVEAGLSKNGVLLRTEQHNVDATGDEKHNEQHVKITDLLHGLLNWREWLATFHDVKPYALRLLSHVHVRRLRCHLLVGTGEVVTSGMATGSIWASLSSVIGFLTFHCKFETKPDIAIDTDFRRAVLESSVECIIRIRAGHAIIAATRLNRVWKRRTKYGSPHSGTHADSDGKYTGNG